jgi:hypothetical protein
MIAFDLPFVTATSSHAFRDEAGSLSFRLNLHGGSARILHDAETFRAPTANRSKIAPANFCASPNRVK